MNGEMLPEMSILAGLQNALGSECPECGEINPSNMESCEICGAPLPVHHDEEPGLSYIHNELIDEPAGSVINIREFMSSIHDREMTVFKMLFETVEKAKAANITFEEYEESIAAGIKASSKGFDLLESIPAQKQIKTFTEEEKNLVNSALQAYELFIEGAKLMMEYDGGEDGTPAIVGLQKADKSMIKMKKIQKAWRS